MRVADIRPTAAQIVGAAKHVSIDDARLRAFADRLLLDPIPEWDGGLHHFNGGRKGILYILLLDAMNFCFWPSMFETVHRGMRYGADDGYLALAAALTRAFEEDTCLADPACLAVIDAEGLAGLLQCEGEVPLLEERAANARDLGRVLIEKYGGDPLELVKAADYDAEKFADLLAQDFPCYADRRECHGICFSPLKRAQICASDLAAAYEAKSGVVWKNTDKLTCFADYKLPQLFHEEGVFRYAPALEAKIRAKSELSQWEEEEAEIRAATIVAVERIKARFAEKGRVIESRHINWMLWNESIIPGRITVPHHRVRTTSY